MERNVNQSESAKITFIIKQWIDGVNEEEKFNYLNNLTDFKNLSTKSYSSFDKFSADIDILVRSAENGKCL